MRKNAWFAILICFTAVILSRVSVFGEDHEFRYKAPDAKNVELLGEWNDWKSVQMSKGDDGVWKAKVTLSPGTYAYKFLVEGKDWVFDPDNPNRKTVGNIENSAVEIK